MRRQSHVLDDVRRLLSQHPDGLAFQDFQHVLADKASERTLHRTLELACTQRLIVSSGVRRGRRYFLGMPSVCGVGENPPPRYQAASRPSTVDHPQAVSFLSDGGREVLAHAQTPAWSRPYVGYQIDFLSRYRPNRTSYLGKTTRRRLAALGATAQRVQPAGTYARTILSRFIVDLSFASSRLEGNTYSWADTRELIERGRIASGKDALETEMILNHKAAIEFLVDADESVGINRYTLTNLHALLMAGLLGDARAEGSLRNSAVSITGSRYVPCAQTDVIAFLFDRLLHLANAIEDPFEQAFFLWVQLPYLQPFLDGNKRTARLAANLPLIRDNLVPISYMDLPDSLYVDGLIGLYELTRVDLLRDLFVHVYERSVERYLVVQSAMQPPDALRLRYRDVLRDVIVDLVRQHPRRDVSPELVITLLAPHVSPDDQPHLLDMILKEIAGLHEGNIARFRIRPSEYARFNESL